MTQPKIRWGILGAATIAKVCLIPAIAKSYNGQLYGIANRTRSKAEQLAQEYQIPHLYTDYEALLADPMVEAVYIPLPNHLHLPWTLKALAAGKHVLCEKPLALNGAEVDRMMDAAQMSNRLLMEAFMYRFHPRSQRIKQMVEQGQIGRPTLLRAAFTFNMQEGLDDENNSRLDPVTGGGALMDVGCYGVSVARWLFAAEPVEVQAQAIYHERGVDTHFVGLLRFPEGQLATIEASFISALQQTYSIVGSHGAVELPHNAFIPWEAEAIFYQRGLEEELGQCHVIPGVDEYQRMVEHFAEAVLGHTPLAFSLEESFNNMRVIDRLRQAAKYPPPPNAW